MAILTFFLWRGAAYAGGRGVLLGIDTGQAGHGRGRGGVPGVRSGPRLSVQETELVVHSIGAHVWCLLRVVYQIP